MNKLILDTIWKKYGEVEAVRDLSFSVKENEFLTIVGPSGCGKSSTLRMIAGLESITMGDMILDGVRINEIRARDRDIALAFESYALYPHMTTFKNLAFPLQSEKVPKKERRERVKSIMKLLNLEKYANNKPGELSGGQQQRISLGRALIRDASIYLLDEPLSHLDAHEKVELRVQLQRIQKLNKLTFILVTHDQLEALEMSDRILVMNHGQMQQIGTPEELYDNPQNLFVADFIGEPPMNFVQGNLLPMTVGKYIIKCQTTQFEIMRANGKDLAPHSGKKVVMGIRPEYISLCDSTTENAIEGLVFSYEDLGEKGYVLVNCNEEKFLVEREGGAKFELDEKVYIRFDGQEVYLFDADDGKRIL